MTQLILFFHILGGFIALASAGISVATVKGSLWHRRAGSIYVLAMLIVTLTTLALVAIRPNIFLLVIGIFSFYLVFTGWRSARVRDGRPRSVDHLAGAVMALTGLGMLGFGASGLLTSSGSQPILLLIFGSIGLVMSLSDWRDWRAGPIAGKSRIARHLTRMLAGTIATLTAAVVVNATFLPTLVAWLGPTAVITPLIFWWNARVLVTQPSR